MSEKFTGRCYCGELQYEINAEPAMKGQCHCRECQYMTGGAPLVMLGIPPKGLTYTKGAPKLFQRTDIDNAVVREFCGNCGTHIVSKPQTTPLEFVKVGTLDDVESYGMPQVAIFLKDKQCFHVVPEGVAEFDSVPG